MKTDVYDSIRFHALHKRRLPTNTPARWVLGAAAAAIVLLGYASTSHAAADTIAKTGTTCQGGHSLDGERLASARA